MKKLSFFKKHVFLILTLAALSISCNENSEDFLEQTIVNLNQPELAFSDQQGEIKTITYNEQSIVVENINGTNIFEGDIMIPNQQFSKVTGRTLLSTRWPKAIVYYAINSSLPNKSRVTNAIAHWEANTRIIFKKRTNQKDYVHFVPGSGCSSFVGRIGGAQEITLADGCTTGSAIHEIGHAVGLWHEQSRKDRDTYIKILPENIESNRQFNFDTYIKQGFDGDEYTPFDINSVMMYGPYFFSKNGQPTITKKNGQLFTNNRDFLSFYDKKGIDKMYLTEYIARTFTSPFFN